MRPSCLRAFKNKHPEREYLVTFHCPEFTSLCPKTGQPDFAEIVIRYIPRERYGGEQEPEALSLLVQKPR